MAKDFGIQIVCDKCGKGPEIDKEKSTPNWVVQNTSARCGCGGNWIMKLKPIAR